MLTNKWETFSEISKRTGIDPVAVIEKVKQQYHSGAAECRFFDRPTEKVTEWRRK